MSDTDPFNRPLSTTLPGAYLDGYLDGAEYALRLYAYSSSEPWAENGVKYVGPTGRTLAAALAGMAAHVAAMRAASEVAA